MNEFELDIPTEETMTERQAAIEMFYIAARDLGVRIAQGSPNPEETALRIGQAANNAFRVLGVTQAEIDAAVGNNPA